MIVFLFCTITTFHFFGPAIVQSCWFMARGQSEEVFVLVANGLFVVTMGREDGKGDLGRQQVCFFSVRTSSRQAINRGDREKQWQSLWFWFTPVLKNPNKLEEQNNTQQEINHINDEALNDSQTWKQVVAGASGGEDGRLWDDIRSRLQRKAENNQAPAVTRRRSLFFSPLSN